MLYILFKVLLISFFISLLWEVTHSLLYETTLKASLKKYVPIILSASLKDGLWILAFYAITVYVFDNPNILMLNGQLLLFIILCLVFSFIDERIALKYKRWVYSKKMPTIFGVGISPLVQLAITGVLAFSFVFLI